MCKCKSMKISMSNFLTNTIYLLYALPTCCIRAEVKNDNKNLLVLHFPFLQSPIKTSHTCGQPRSIRVAIYIFRSGASLQEVAAPKPGGSTIFSGLDLMRDQSESPNHTLLEDETTEWFILAFSKLLFEPLPLFEPVAE